MSRKVYVIVTTRIIMDIDEGMEVSDIIQEMDYNFNPNEAHSSRVEFDGVEIQDFEVVDSK